MKTPHEAADMFFSLALGAEHVTDVTWQQEFYELVLGRAQDKLDKLTPDHAGIVIEKGGRYQMSFTQRDEEPRLAVVKIVELNQLYVGIHDESFTEPHTIPIKRDYFQACIIKRLPDAK